VNPSPRPLDCLAGTRELTSRSRAAGGTESGIAVALPLARSRGGGEPKSNMRQWVVVDANKKTTDILWSPPALSAQKEEPT
jgi:hypothetical protein